MHACMHMYVYVDVCTHIYMCKRILHVCIYVYVYTCICVNMHVYECMYMCLM